MIQHATNYKSAGVDEAVNDGAQLFVMFAYLEAKSNRMVHEFPLMGKFPEVFPYDISDLSLKREV